MGKTVTKEYIAKQIVNTVINGHIWTLFSC